MRVTGGRLAGRTLQLPKGPRIRSTQDQVRQALFNLLGERVEGARVLDLFCGSGAVGIEALSRGAAHVTFVDRSGFSVEATQTNLENLTSVPGTAYPVPGTGYRAMRADGVSAIGRLARAGKQFDLVFLDPPYGENLPTKTLKALGGCAIVAPSGWVVVEQEKRDPLVENPEGNSTQLLLQRVERYGDTALVIYQRQ